MQKGASLFVFGCLLVALGQVNVANGEAKKPFGTMGVIYEVHIFEHEEFQGIPPIYEQKAT